MRRLLWVLVYGLLFCVLCFHAAPSRSKIGVTELLQRLVKQYKKLKHFEGEHNISTRKRSDINSVLKSIIQENAEKIRTRTKLRRSKKPITARQKKYYDLRDKIASAVESITFPAPQLKRTYKSELDRLLERMKEKTLEDQRFHQRNSELRVKKKAVVNDSFSNELNFRPADKESDNPHPAKKILSVYQQAHEGNNTGDDELEENLRIIHAEHTINPNPHPDLLKASYDPLRISLRPITSEVDEDEETPNDKPKGHEKDRSKRPAGVNYKPGKAENKNMSKSANKTVKNLKPPDNWSLATNKEDKLTDPALKLLNTTKEENATQKYNTTKTRLHKSSNMVTPIKENDADDWTDRRTHALAILAKLSSDLDQPDVIDNVMQALGIADIIKLDRPLVQHDEIEGGPDVFDRDSNWVDEELGENSGSGDHLFSSRRHRNKNNMHPVQVIKEAFFPQKGQLKDFIQNKRKKGLGIQNDEIGNLVND
ncbi:uncharacterized protein LOC130636236 [Hydractinia symbiolongicarpus]|uniref:uncharacterized protein LOC130636236 n=1 Tax=Hydractinia symbiolongicarpus TaxID=13093 RepID=UPI00254ECAC7|nr:uncharacterized protein LOC130636236 [Hydractinia symbiolongicarpus]